MRAVSGDFWSWFSKFNAEDVTGFIAVVLVFSVAAVAVICLTVYLVHKNRTEIALKRELLDRGLTADEIATVVSAKADRGLPRRSSRLN
jgi:hypothetical protein